MRVFHLSDIHYCPKYVDEVDRCMRAAIRHAAVHKPDVIVLSGDLFDHRLELHTGPVQLAIASVQVLADIAPTLVLQGTFSHDTPGSLNVLRRIDAAHSICVVDRLCQVALTEDRLTQSNDWKFDTVPNNTSMLFSCLPTLNKADLVAHNADESIGDHVAAVLLGWSEGHLEARAANVPTAVVSHGTVSGCLTEHNVPMAGLDHEFTTGSLFSAEADAVLLGHIHKHQQWTKGPRRIAYAGSIGRLHFGEKDPKGVLDWRITSNKADFSFIEMPARELFEREFDGPPDVDELTACAKSIDWDKPVHARLRIRVDADWRHAVDEALIRELFAEATTLQIDIRVNPIQRQRAPGIADAPSTADQVKRWCDYTDTPAAPLLERLARLEQGDDTKIVAEIANG